MLIENSAKSKVEEQEGNEEDKLNNKNNNNNNNINNINNNNTHKYKDWWFVHIEDFPLLEEYLTKLGGSLYKDNFWLNPTELAASGIRYW
jgi:hypothetical protein